MNKEEKIDRIDELFEKHNLFDVANELDYYTEDSLDELLKYLEEYDKGDQSIEEGQHLNDQITMWESQYSFSRSSQN